MAVASTLGRQRLQETLVDPGTYATTLIMLVIDEFGTESFDWEPDTFQIEVAETWGIELPPLAWDKIYAVIVILTTDQPFQTIEGFNAVCNPLNNNPAIFTHFDPPDAAEAAWCLTEMQFLMGSDYDTRMFQPELKAYFRALLDEEDIIEPPPIFKMAYIKEGPSLQMDIEPFISEAIQQRSLDGKRDIEVYTARRLIGFVEDLKSAPLMTPDPGWAGTLTQMAETIDKATARV